MKTKIKPCPFCGSGTSEGDNGPQLLRGDYCGQWLVCCGYCAARGPMVSVEQAKKAAVMAWNRRISCDEPEN